VKSQNLALACIVILALALGVWLAYPNQEPPHDETPTPAQRVENVRGQTAEPVPTRPVPSLADDKPTQTTAEVPQTSTAPPVEDVLAKAIQRFEGRSDADPVLSRELEYVVQAAIYKSLDTKRFDVRSLVCRGNGCQVILIDNSPVAGKPSVAGMGQLMKGLDSMPVRNPSTGEALRPQLQEIGQAGHSPGATYSYFTFDKPKTSAALQIGAQ
jgi:hypothetical protein